MKFKVGELIVDLDAPLRIRQIVEAEKALEMGLEDSGTARVAVFIFATLRAQNPEKPVEEIAGEVLATDMTKLEEVEESPPAIGLVKPQTSGAQPSEASA